jgi:hypothetical protein
MQEDDQEEFDAKIADLRARLGDKSFERAWSEGYDMTLDQAVEYALSDV